METLQENDPKMSEMLMDLKLVLQGKLQLKTYLDYHGYLIQMSGNPKQMKLL